jgi:hypothetical protein
MEMHGFVWETKASFSCWRERVNHAKNGDAWICMGDKSFIFMLERESKPCQKWEMYAFVWEKKASFSCWRG